jgi:hypothetical protein
MIKCHKKIRRCLMAANNNCAETSTSMLHFITRRISFYRTNYAPTLTVYAKLVKGLDNFGVFVRVQRFS